MKKIRNKAYSRLLAAIILLLFTVITLGSTGAEPLPEKLVIGYQAIPNPQTVIKDLGWHEKALGIPIKWVPFDSGRLVSEALAAGNVDIGLVGSSPCAAGIAQGIPMEVVWIHDVIGDSEALVVKKDSKINKLEDLIGKHVAVPFGSTTHYHLMRALKLENIESNRLDIVNLEPSQMLDAWKRDEIDAAFVWEPTLSKLRENGGAVLLSSRKLVERGFPTADLSVVREAFVTRYPDVVIKYLQTLDRGVKFCRTNPDEAAAAIARQFGVSQDKAAQQMKGLILLSGQEQISGKFMGDVQFHFGLYTMLKETADFLEEAKQIESSPPWPVFMRAVDSVYINKALE